METENNEDVSLLKMVGRRRKAINDNAITVCTWEFRKELNIYLTRASFGNPVLIRLATGQTLRLSSL